MDFQEADRRYVDIKRSYESGGLTQEELDEQLEQLMVQGEEGRWWAKSRSAGEWYYHDGTTWVKRTLSRRFSSLRLISPRPPRLLVVKDCIGVSD